MVEQGHALISDGKQLKIEKSVEMTNYPRLSFKTLIKKKASQKGEEKKANVSGI